MLAKINKIHNSHQLALVYPFPFDWIQVFVMGFKSITLLKWNNRARYTKHVKSSWKHTKFIVIPTFNWIPYIPKKRGFYKNHIPAEALICKSINKVERKKAKKKKKKIGKYQPRTKLGSWFLFPSSSSLFSGKSFSVILLKFHWKM